MIFRIGLNYFHVIATHVLNGINRKIWRHLNLSLLWNAHGCFFWWCNPVTPLIVRTVNGSWRIRFAYCKANNTKYFPKNFIRFFGIRIERNIRTWSSLKHESTKTYNIFKLRDGKLDFASERFLLGTHTMVTEALWIVLP